MAYTLSNVLRDALDDGLGQMTVVRATGGSTTTAVDANANGAYGDDQDALLNGTIIVIRDNGGAGAAPEGEFNRISDFDGTTITVDTAFTAAVASGDTIGIVQPTFPLLKCINSVNTALQELGRIWLVDKVTIVPAASTTEYTWAVAWKYDRPFKIEVQGITNVTGMNNWYEITDYDVEPALPGTAGKLIFRGILPVGHTIKVHYWGVHPTLFAFNDPISESIHQSLAKRIVTETLAGWYYKQGGGEQPVWREIWNQAQTALQQAKIDFPIGAHPDEQPRTFAVGGASSDFPPSPFSWTKQ